jgi:hypothetical protein
MRSLYGFTALSTSLALATFSVESPYERWHTGLERMIARAVRKCIREQYWKV